MNTNQSTNKVCSTGVEGLDHILCGGLPAERIYLIQGEPGVGKTTVGIQFLLEGLRCGERVLYITLSETREELLRVAESHGWDLSGFDFYELSTLTEDLEGKVGSTFFHPSEVELNRTTAALLEQVEKVDPARVVFDSLSEMRMLAETPLRYRRQMLQFKQYFANKKATVCFLDDKSGQRDLQIESIAHGVILLTRQSPEYGIARRQLNVRKIRGATFREGHHDLVIKRGGVQVFPRLVAAEHRKDGLNREHFPSGIANLDALLGGGLDRGTSNMFLGPPGTGKSTLAIKFACEAGLKKEKSMLFIFDESPETLVARAHHLGMDVRPLIDEGLLHLEQVDPAEISPGELAHKIRSAVLEQDVKMVIIDSINGYMNAMPEEKYLNLQLHELLAFLSQMGVITIMVLAQHGVVGALRSAVDLTYLADTLVLIQYFESDARVRQAISVIKKRSSDHERNIREFSIENSKITVGATLKNFQGVLTGSPSAIDRAMGVDANLGA